MGEWFMGKQEIEFEDLSGAAEIAETLGEELDIQFSEESGAELPNDEMDAAKVESLPNDLAITVVEDEPADTLAIAPVVDEPVVSKAVVVDFEAGQSESNELVEMRAENRKLRLSNLESNQKNMEREYAAEKVKLKAAIEDGNTDDQVEINDRLIDLKGGMIKNDVDIDSAKQEPVQTVSNPQLDAWVGKNSWYGSPGNEGQTEAVHRIDKQMAAENMDSRSPGYFVELNKRLVKQEPAMFAGKETEKAEPSPKVPKSPPIANTRSAAGTSKKGGNKITLTRADLDQMHQFGLDPSNKEHLISFARERQRSSVGVQ